MNDIKMIKNKTNTTKNSFEKLENKCAVLEQQVQELSLKVNWYEEQFRLSQEKRYGVSSEKSDPDQLSFFNEAENEADPKVQEPTVEEITYKRRKTKGTNDKKLENLPVEVIEYELNEEEQICPKCEQPLHKMSKEVRKELQIIPAEVKVVEHVRYVYACRHCEKTDITTPIITASMPKSILPGSIVSSSLMAYIMDQKYTQALPLYRQEQQFKRRGIDLSRQTLSNWVIHGANNWLSLIYERMHTYLVKEDVLHADETPLQVLCEDGRKATTKSYMWLFATGKTSKPIYLYDYQTTRASKHPKKFLETFKGFLHTDGYAGYNDIPNTTIVGCLAHARRKFDEALKALPDKKSITATSAKEGFDYCNKLFTIERHLSEVSFEERYKKRLEQSKPVLEAFLVWLKAKKKQALPKSAFGKAINYCLNQWSKLSNFLKDGRLEISNNRAERAIKLFVIGRKNFLFCNTPKGAIASAITYSIIETAKANNLNPFHYLTYVFDQLPNIDVSDHEQIDALLPWSSTLPEICKICSKK